MSRILIYGKPVNEEKLKEIIKPYGDIIAEIKEPPFRLISKRR